MSAATYEACDGTCDACGAETDRTPTYGDVLCKDCSGP